MDSATLKSNLAVSHKDETFVQQLRGWTKAARIGINKSLTRNVEWKKQAGKWFIEYYAIYVNLKTIKQYCILLMET